MNARAQRFDRIAEMLEFWLIFTISVVGLAKLETLYCLALGIVLAAVLIQQRGLQLSAVLQLSLNKSETLACLSSCLNAAVATAVALLAGRIAGVIWTV